MKKLKRKYEFTQTEKEQQIDELLKRYPIFSDMEENCQCCANCNNWVIDKSISGRYEHNACRVIGELVLTKCCMVCDEYVGNKTEKNIPCYEYEIIEVDS